MAKTEFNIFDGITDELVESFTGTEEEAIKRAKELLHERELKYVELYRSTDKGETFVDGYINPIKMLETLKPLIPDE